MAGNAMHLRAVGVAIGAALKASNLQRVEQKQLPIYLVGAQAIDIKKFAFFCKACHDSKIYTGKNQPQSCE